MKIKTVGTIQSISASKHEATVKLAGQTICVVIPPGSKEGLLKNFSQGRAFVDIEVEVTNPVVVFP